MVQMSSLATRSKPDRLPPGTEIPPLENSSVESESASYENSIEDRKLFSIEIDKSKTFPPQAPSQNDIYEDMSRIFDGHHTGENTDVKPKNVCRVCQAEFSNEDKLAYHLQEKHMNYQPKAKRSKPKNRHKFKVLSKLFPAALPVIQETRDTCPTNEEDATEAAESEIHPVVTADTSKTQETEKRRKRKLLTPLPPRSRPRRRKVIQEIAPQPRPTHCVLCNTVYRTYLAWRTHAVNDHILKQDPTLRVEMNYVDVQTIGKEAGGEGAIITTAKNNGTPGRGSIQEQLKLTFCREKGSYVVKNPSFSGDLVDSAGVTTSTPLICDEGGDGDAATEEGSTSPSSSPRNTGSSSGEISMLADKENSEPRVVITESEVPGNRLVSKVPTSGTVVYLGSGASESDKTLANTGNSHMVIIQNDILHIGEDADEENVQRITAATTAANTPLYNNRKVIETLKEVLTEELNISVDKESPKNSPIVSILNMSPFSRPIPEEITAMISEEMQGNNGLLKSKEIDSEYSHQRSGDLEHRQRDSGDDSSTDSMQLKIAIGENGGESPTGPQESHQQESPKEVLPNPKDSDHPNSNSPLTDNLRNTYSDVPSSTASAMSMGMPFHVTLPCGIEIEQLMPIPGRRESMESNQSEDIDVDDSGIGDSSRTSELVIDEDVSRDGDDSDDFRCKVCNALFTSDDELETHFSEAHFRGIANNILEEQESLLGPPEAPMPPPAHASSSGGINGGIYRSTSTENLVCNFSIQGNHPPGSRSERRPSDGDARLAEYRVTHGNFTNSQFFHRADGVPQSLLMRTPQGLGSTTTVSDRSSVSARNVGQSPYAQSPSREAGNTDTLSQRTELQGNQTNYPNIIPRSIANLQMQLNRNPPPLSSRTSGGSQHPAPFQYLSQQQPQPQGRGTPPKTNYPNALHNALNSVVQLGTQRSITVARHGSLEPDGGTRHIDAAASLARSMANAIAPAQQLTSSQVSPSQQQRNHLLAMAHHQRQQQQYQLLQQQNMRSRQQDQQQRQSQSQSQSQQSQSQTQRQANMTDLQRQQQTLLLEQQQRQIRSQVQQSQLQQYTSQQLLGKRPSPHEVMSTIHKQARLDGQAHVTQETRGRPSGSLTLGRVDFPNQNQSGTNSSQLASALGTGGVRLGTSITLSVCSGDENRNDNSQQSPNFSLLRNSIITGQSQRSPVSALGSNSNTMASALAVRGVTVSPASPTLSSDFSENGGIPIHRMQQQISASPNQTRASPSDIPNSVSVIQNGSAHSATPSPPNHQFAMPHTPAPRTSSAERPDRPPTVDLTTDEMNAYAAQQSRYLESRRQTQPSLQLPSTQRPPNRPAVACNLCGVLFCSLANLEEHKIHRHGFRQNETSSSGQGRGHPSPPLRVQQSVRTANTFRPPNNAAVNQRSLFIPLLDITRMDTAKLKRLEELGVCSMIPLQGNDRALGQMGIPLLLPTINLRDGPQLPWDQLQPVGPVFAPSQVAQNYTTPRALPLPNSSNH